MRRPLHPSELSACRRHLTREYPASKRRAALARRFRKYGDWPAMNSSPSLLIVAATSVAALGATAAIAQKKSDQAGQQARVEHVISPDQEMGKRFQVLPSDLLPPRTGP